MNEDEQQYIRSTRMQEKIHWEFLNSLHGLFYLSTYFQRVYLTQFRKTQHCDIAFATCI